MFKINSTEKILDSYLQEFLYYYMNICKLVLDRNPNKQYYLMICATGAHFLAQNCSDNDL